MPLTYPRLCSLKSLLQRPLAVLLLLTTGLLCTRAADDTPPSAPAYTPYFFDDFEARPLDTILPSPYGTCGRSKATTEQAFRGSRSARMEIRAGDAGGFGRWGAILGITPALVKGQEVWVRLYIYWPASFTFSASPWMKFLRLHTTPVGGGKSGYHDLYVHHADSTTSVLRTIKEVHDKWAVYDGSPLPRDRWESYEMYVKLDNLSVDQGGEGRVRIWRDGQLIFNRTDVPTLVSAPDLLDAFYLFTYWNNENPPNNFCYIDDLAIATSTNPPPQTDNSGNRMIGTWAPDTTAPTMPTALAGTAASATTINLTWTASTDAVGVAGYRIFRDGNQVGTPTTTTYTDTGLTTGTTYSYTVCAVDVAGNVSLASTPLSVVAHDETFTNYAAWRSANFTTAEQGNSAISGPSADPSGSGVPNLLRYACGLPARGPAAAPATASIITDASQNYLALTFPRKGYAPDLEYIVQSSTDLITWTDLPTVLPGYPKMITVRDLVPVSGQTRRFLRLRITQQ